MRGNVAMAPARYAARPTTLDNEDIARVPLHDQAQNFLMRPMRFMIRKAATEDRTSSSAAHRNPILIVREWQPLGIHAENAGDEGRRQQQRCQHRQNAQAVVALLLDFQMKLFLQHPAAFSHFDHGVIEAVEALRQFSGAKLQRRLQLLEVALLQAEKNDPQARELAMQPHAGPAQAAELLPQVRRLIGQHLLLDLVKRLRNALGDTIHGIGDVLDDRLEQRSRAADTMSGLERAARGIHCTQRVVPSADENAFGHDEMQIAGLFGSFRHVAFEVRDHPIHGIVVGMHLLIVIAGDQQCSRRGRHVQL